MRGNKFKVALCMYGQPRNFEFCFPSLKKHILDVYHPDVFTCIDEQGDRIKELYNPVAMEVCSQEQTIKEIGPRRRMYGKIVACPHWPTFQINVPNEISLMYYALKCKHLLKLYEEEHGIYDVIIMTRFDIKFLHIQPITLPEENTLYIPLVDANQWPADPIRLHWTLGHAIHIGWGTSKLMSTLIDTYNWSDEYYKKVGVFCGEIMLKRFCDDNNIKIVYTDVEQMIIRGTKDNPIAWDRLSLSDTHYPQYLEPPLPKSGHIHGYEPWIGKQWVDSIPFAPKVYPPHQPKKRRTHERLHRRKNENK
jgi:hypothetical protein